MKPHLTHFIRVLGLAACLCGSASANELTLAAVTTLPIQNAPESSQTVDNNAIRTVELSATQNSTNSIQTVDLTAHESDIWGRIRHGFGMTDLKNDLVDKQVTWYENHPQQLNALLNRGNKYLFHVVTELEKRGMPTELALLPMVESAYNPMAMSPAKAAGLWQFIPSTGKDFNLQQNWWVDERRDVVASTNAALQYLQAVYEMHGDWQLALASYNWGENAVARAINNNRAAGKPTDYGSLNMPQETRNYVPRLQALKNMIAHPEQYGIQLPNVPNEPYFTQVEKPKGIDVAVAAKLAEMPVNEFQALNPSYNRPVTSGTQNNSLILPVANAEKFRINLISHDQPLSNWRTYALPRSARVDEIARGLQMAVDALCSANGLPARAKLAAGYTLLVPITAAERLHDILISTTAPVEQSAPKKYRNYRHR